MSSYPTQSSASGIWNIGDISLYIQDGAWPTAGNLGTFGAGRTPTNINTIDYINITTTGNATDWGDMLYALHAVGGLGNFARGLFAGGGAPATNSINFITWSSKGDAQDFGDLIQNAQGPAGMNDSSRGIFGTVNVYPTGGNVINYVTIASTGNAIDFGDTTVTAVERTGFSSNTRGIFGGGYTNSPVATDVNVIDFITIQSLGNATDFGDLPNANRYQSASGSSKTRGIFAGGVVGPTASNVISYITIASAGNTTDFGDLTAATYRAAGVSNQIRLAIGGGNNPGITNVIEYVTISTTGDATDFGDLTVGRQALGGASNGNGGLPN